MKLTFQSQTKNIPINGQTDRRIEQTDRQAPGLYQSIFERINSLKSEMITEWKEKKPLCKIKRLFFQTTI